MRGPKDGILSVSATSGKDLAVCVVLGVTIASHVTMYVYHPVTFGHHIDFFRHFMTFLDVSIQTS